VQPHPVAVIQDETRARINCMALAPGGRYLATAHDDTTVKIFGTLVCCVLWADFAEMMESDCSSVTPLTHFCKPDIQSMSLVATLSAHSGAATSVAWSPDQRQLVSVGACEHASSVHPS
jgi:WD40 repeat protein